MRVLWEKMLTEGLHVLVEVLALVQLVFLSQEVGHGACGRCGEWHKSKLEVSAFAAAIAMRLESYDECSALQCAVCSLQWSVVLEKGEGNWIAIRGLAAECKTASVFSGCFSSKTHREVVSGVNILPGNDNSWLTGRSPHSAPHIILLGLECQFH